MTASLLDFLKVAHRVLDFLIEQPADRLVAFAAGEFSLTWESTGGASPPRRLPPAAEAAGSTEAAPAEHLAGPTGPDPGSTGTAPAPVAQVKPPRRRAASKPPSSTVAPAEVAAQLRKLNSVDDGVAYLATVKLRVAELRAVAGELGLSVSTGTRKEDLERKILGHAIGARRKFAGLATW